MIKSIQYLTGTASEWTANDIVIPKGEPAILITANGRYKMKIGNGTSAFSALPFTDGESIKHLNFSKNLEVKHGTHNYASNPTSQLNIIIPKKPDDDFFATVSFKTGSNPPLVTVEGAEVYFTGDGTSADGSFIPEINTYYSIFIWYEGRYEAVVRGRPDV